MTYIARLFRPEGSLLGTPLCARVGTSVSVPDFAWLRVDVGLGRSDDMEDR